ncbi:helix-turn-helix domain-containing protein [Halorubrum rubrum]|uniref:Helix-turn-helix domain-containing protein n=1 Tax=Halorubrum rubrum TaxID=1126240 RepID=A0ABD5R4G8_9EURY|nr:helix-turn-helix domain-containing protein [Halorubrum rubrum]
MTRSEHSGGDTKPERVTREAARTMSASAETVDEALKTRVMDEAPVGITVADATRPDMPLIYANAAFERITGYPPSYAVGRNCRFLQGEETRDAPVERMRAAIEEGTATTVELRNYRRGGDLFWNAVTLAPLRDETGEVAYYVGFQQDVTPRKHAERAAADRAARIERERLAQERLLERLDGVVADVTEAVTRASSRAELREAVVESLANTYVGTWIGGYDPATETVLPEAAGGTTEPDVEDRAVAVDDPGDRTVDRVVAEAVDGRAVRLASLEAEGPDEAAAVAGVPLHFGEATYGVVAVYVQTEEFRDYERDVLAALGRTIAIGINALESQRTLRGDEVVEFRLEIGDHPLAAFGEALSCSLRYAGTVGDREERSFLFELDDADGVDAETIRAAGRDAGVTVHAVFAAATETPVVELSVGESPLEELLREYSGELCGWSVEGGVAIATVEVGRETLARSLANDALDRFENADLRSYRRRERRHETRREFVAEIESRLTDRQRAALLRAYTSGYFEWPHKTTGEELADSMGIGRSTFHQHLRAAYRKIATAIFDR